VTPRDRVIVLLCRLARIQSLHDIGKALKTMHQARVLMRARS
jgi:hypothetical protein